MEHLVLLSCFMSIFEFLALIVYIILIDRSLLEQTCAVQVHALNIFMSEKSSYFGYNRYALRADYKNLF